VHKEAGFSPANVGGELSIIALLQRADDVLDRQA
jgi:hypothetical protein